MARHLRRRRRNCSANVLSVDDLAMGLTIGPIIDSTTDVTMSGTQTPAPSVGSEVLLDIGPRLLTVPVEVDKNEEARTSTCLAVDTARPSHRAELFRNGKGPRWVSCCCQTTGQLRWRIGSERDAQPLVIRARRTSLR